MWLIKRILFQSYLCQQQYSASLTNNESNTFIIGDSVTGNSLNSKSLISKTVREYPSSINIRTKYTTDEEDYTLNESIIFSIRTNQQILQAITILAGFAYENIHYVFNIENGRPEIISSQDDLSDLILTTNEKCSLLINDGEWHRFNIERSNQKLRFILNNIKQSEIEFSNEWQTKTNIFIEVVLIPTPNGDYIGKIGDIVVTDSSRSLSLHKEENNEHFKNPLTFNDKNYTDDMNQSESSRRIVFLPNDNDKIIFPLSIKSAFQTLIFISSLIQFEQINLNINVDGYLSLVVRGRQTQRIFSNNNLKPINDENLYFVQLEFNNKTLKAWIDKNKGTSIELPSSFLIIENLIFGSHNQFIGCIENITYNNQILSFNHLSLNRQQCLLNNTIFKSTNQILSFKEHDDLPLILIIDNPEEFDTFSLVFYTQESNSIICALSDETYENIITLQIHHKQTLMNNSINDKNEHKISIKLMNKNHLLFELDGILIVTEKIINIFHVNKICIGQLDSFIKEQFSDLNGENFIGCMKDVIFNGRSLIKLEHIHRLENTCQMTKREGKNLISYVSPNVSFSIRDHHDIIQLQLKPNREFHSYQMLIKTHSSNGTITSMYSNDDHHGLILNLKDGKLQVKVYSFIFNDNQTINDGQQHLILLTRSYISTNGSTRYTNTNPRAFIISL